MSDSGSEKPVRKKRKLNKHNHKKEKKKMAKNNGEAHESWIGRPVPMKTTGPDCNCPRKCTSKFTEEEKQILINRVYDGQPKNQRDVFLMGFIDKVDIQRRRPSKVAENVKNKDSWYKYFALKGCKRLNVCRKAYLSLHATSNTAVYRLCKLISEQKAPKDMRGLHQNRGNLLPNDIIVKIHEHVKEFPLKMTHYSNKEVFYLDSALSVAKMHELFIVKYPDLKNKVKYEYYLKTYKENFNYPFKRPQVDVCSTCEDLSIKIKSPALNDVAKRVAVAEMMVHKRRAKKFYNKIKDITEYCREQTNSVGLIFDYMQNLPLPFLPVQEMFYLRKLWHNVFCIYNTSTQTSVFYTYHEGEGKKGPDEVCSFLWHYIQNFVPPSVQFLYVFSDACGGQNRNHTLIRFLSSLSIIGRFEKIEQYFPLRGHSFLPCDRNFVLIKRQVKKHDRIYSQTKYNELIEISNKSENKPFKVHKVLTEEIINFKDWWPNYFKKTTKSVGQIKVNFSISTYRHIIYDSNMKGYVETCEFIDGAVRNVFLLTKKKDVVLPTEKAYSGKMAINKKKIEDLRKIIHYIPEDDKFFYEEIVNNWPVTCKDDDDDSNE